MSKKKFKEVSIPSEQEVTKERERLKNKKEYRRVLRSTVFILIVVAAVAVLVATLFIPVLQVSGTSMEPTLRNGDIIALHKSGSYETGDLCGFYWQNKLLLKRIIGKPGDIINIDDDGKVYVNNKALKEPYIKKLSKGICNVEFPYQVPENRYFIMGDNRETSVDSRSTSIGCIERDQIVGKVFLRIWPLNRISFVK